MRLHIRFAWTGAIALFLALTITRGGIAGTILYQNGVNGAAVHDTFIKQSQPTSNFGTSQLVEWDGEDGGGMDFALIRFDNIFGSGANQIKSTDQITDATLMYNVSDAGDTASVNELLVDWDQNVVTYGGANAIGGDDGVQANEYGTFLGNANGGTGVRSINVTGSIAAWALNPSANKGWIFRPTGGTNGVQFRSSQYGIANERVRLQVVLNEGAPVGRTLQVRHEPYLQLGDAPLASTGVGIGTTDQIVIVWQTVEAGSGDPPTDYFEVEYRPAGGGAYSPVAPIETLVTGFGSRVNHSVTITGLEYDAGYEYRVFHKRNPGDPVTVETYTGNFTTRLATGDPTSFRFATYGDSARIGDSETMSNFESVMNRVTIMDAAFVQLLGDNIYDIGTHDAFDARLDGSVAPIQSAYIRNHIEYYCDGNHDSGDPDDGIASRHNYYCPIPVQGVTSPVPFPSGEHPEDNYSFDYGLVHFSVLDSTAWGNVTPSRPGLPSPARQASIRTWLLADLAASDQPWKIVVTHHPLICTIDKSDIPSFATQIIEDVANLGADLILVGHSHTYQRSYPLVTYNPNDNPPTTFILDTDNEFEKGAHVIQVVAGTGGRPIRSGTPASGSASDWLDSWFSTNSSPQGEVGPVIIDVSPTELHVQYIAADNGFVFDEFKIVVPGPKIVATPPSVERTIFIGDPVPSGDSFSVANGGPDMMNYSLSESTSWFNVSPTTGDSTGEADTIDVTYLPEVEGFLAGEYVGQITITSPEASNSPLMIPVTLTIESVSPDFDGDGDVDIDDHAHLQECLSGQGKTQNDPNCADALLQGPDTDVDQDDLQVLIGCLSGKNIPADPTCDD